MKEISPIEWFGNRRLDFCPSHFVKSHTALTEERRLWVENNLHGRYAIWFSVENHVVKYSDVFIAFEEPGDAMLYELHWA